MSTSSKTRFCKYIKSICALAILIIFGNGMIFNANGVKESRRASILQQDIFSNHDQIETNVSEPIVRWRRLQKNIDNMGKRLSRKSNADLLIVASEKQRAVSKKPILTNTMQLIKDSNKNSASHSRKDTDGESQVQHPSTSEIPVRVTGEMEEQFDRRGQILSTAKESDPINADRNEQNNQTILLSNSDESGHPSTSEIPIPVAEKIEKQIVQTTNTTNTKFDLAPSPAAVNFNKAASAVKFHQAVEAVSSNMVSERMNDMNLSSFVAPAAGDDAPASVQKGLWVRGVYGYSKQGLYTNADGQQELGARGHSKGMTVGFDLDIGDDKMFGVAAGRVRGDFKDQDSAAASINKSNIYTLYAKFDKQKLVWDNTISLIDSKISSEFVDNGNLYKSDFKNYGLVYNTKVHYKASKGKNVQIMPFIGLKYSHYYDKAQRATSESADPINIASRRDQNLKILTGMSLKKSLYNKPNSELKIIGSLEGSVAFNAMDKRADTKIMSEAGQHIGSMKSDRQTRPSYGINVGTMIKYKSLEVMGSYNFQTQGTYHSHQGSLRVEVLL